jgi:predicted nucleic acid-binding protein
MILVDTSVLIDFLKGNSNDRVSAFSEILERRLPYGINEFIYQEVLQGAATVAEFDKLREYFETIPQYQLKEGKRSFEKAAYLNFVCRKAGITIRSTIDLLIAQTAIENDLLLLHNDRDFTNMAKAIPELRMY